MADDEHFSTDSESAVGAVLNGQWKLLRVVGEGGLAAVYEAEGLQGQGRKAIKLLHPMFASKASVVERFQTEAQTCYTLRHPHIANVEGHAHAEDGTPYIVMELLHGASLEEFLMGGHTMAPEQAVPIIYGVLQALSVAHARGIVHRDLKPANLFLVREPDGRFTPKVLDFGVAKVMDLAGGMGSKTRTGALLGTPGYMSPEQVKDAKKVDARTDLWAVAVVFFEMLTGHHPFESSDKLARMVAVLRDPPRPITQFKPELASFAPFFERGLAREPSQRFASAEEMVEALRETARQASPPTQAAGQQTVALPQMPDTMQAGVAPPSTAPAAGMGPGSTRPDDSSLPIELGQPVATGGAAAPGPSAGMPGVATRTQISGDSPAGSPTYISGRPPPPEVAVVTAPDVEPPSLVWWGVVLVALACIGLGIVVGYLIAAA